MNEVRAQGEVCGRHYSSGGFMKLEWDGGVITRFESVDVEPRVWLAPGLFDLQINGFGGIGRKVTSSIALGGSTAAATAAVAA